MTAATTDDAQRASALLDRFAFELLVLAYEFDHYFPSLVEHPALRQTFEVSLPARADAARRGFAGGTAGAPFEQFVDFQLQRARASLENALDTAEAVAAFADASDALYHWLRRYDCIDAERVRVAVLVVSGEQVMLTRLADGPWGLPDSPQELDESIQGAARRVVAESSGAQLQADDICGTVAQSYDFDTELGCLCITVYVLADYDDSRGALPPAPAGRESLLASWNKLPQALSDSLASLSESGFDPCDQLDKP